MNSATVSLGKPITAPFLIPVLHNATPNCIAVSFMVNGTPYEVTALSFGAPHGAVFVDGIDSIDVPALGTSIGTHPRFPKGADIVFVEALDGDHLKARLWRRGEGETAFTSEAACVAGVAAIMLQKIKKSNVEVSMGGNAFRVQWDRADGNASLTGPTVLGSA